ncbi:sigma-70 family RNA polymerase sigma factor [Cellulomonas sp. NPDC055163]
MPVHGEPPCGGGPRAGRAGPDVLPAARPHRPAHRRGFVREVIRTTFLDQLRRKRAWTSRAHLFVQPEAAADVPDRSAAAAVDVQIALNALPPRERACVVLRYFDDLPVAEIAHALGISHGSVKRYLSDGSAKLRLSLDVTVRLDEPGTASVAVHPVTRTERSQS